MMYPIRNNKKKFLGLDPAKILIAIFIAVFFLVFSFWSPARSLIENILSPVFKTGNFFYGSLDNISKYFSEKNSLMEENANLLVELENNRIDNIDFESVKYENQKLREELKLKPAGDFITAFVIAKSPQIPLDSLFLDGGVNDGINDGDSVFASERVIIGKIVKVSGNKSTVALNSFAGTVSYGYVARTNEPLQIIGSGGGTIEAKVPIDFDIIIGDKIMIGGSVNSLAAIVGAVEEDRSSGFKKVLLSLPVDVSKINTVFIYPTNA